MEGFEEDFEEGDNPELLPREHSVRFPSLLLLLSYSCDICSELLRLAESMTDSTLRNAWAGGMVG